MGPGGTLDQDAADGGGLAGWQLHRPARLQSFPPERARFFLLFPALRTGLLSLRPSGTTEQRLLRRQGSVLAKGFAVAQKIAVYWSCAEIGHPPKK